MVSDLENDLPLATVHLYVTAVLTFFRVCVYCAFTGSSNSLSFFSDSGEDSGPKDSGSRSTSGDTSEGELFSVKHNISKY